MTSQNITNFIGQNAFTAEKLIMTDFCDQLICESIYGSFLINCPDQNLYREIVFHLAAIQREEREPEEFPVATRAEVQAIWDAEEAAVMQAEMRML